VQRSTQLLLIDAIGATIPSEERCRARDFGIPVMSYAQLIATYFYYVPTTRQAFSVSRTEYKDVGGYRIAPPACKRGGRGRTTLCSHEGAELAPRAARSLLGP
jgi:hypothetical protein